MAKRQELPYALDPNRLMTDPIGDFVPDSMKNDEPIREKIVELGTLITDRAAVKLGKHKLTKEDPEYWGLAGLLTDEQAEICIRMKKREPKTFEEMCALNPEYTPEDLQKQLDYLSWCGVVEWNYENDKHEL
ncbi:MAG: pyridine nucleotide-disulfide oxidoreductase, partial [Lachnospiraceae bacterium]|nr:pyridine nucleotide-disulfide oxidoreductase [Lachnospiraceae bacterium]